MSTSNNANGLNEAIIRCEGIIERVMQMHAKLVQLRDHRSEREIALALRSAADVFSRRTADLGKDKQEVQKVIMSYLDSTGNSEIEPIGCIRTDLDDMHHAITELEQLAPYCSDYDEACTYAACTTHAKRAATLASARAVVANSRAPATNTRAHAASSSSSSNASNTSTQNMLGAVSAARVASSDIAAVLPDDIVDDDEEERVNALVLSVTGPVEDDEEAPRDDEPICVLHDEPEAVDEDDIDTIDTNDEDEVVYLRTAPKKAPAANSAAASSTAANSAQKTTTVKATNPKLAKPTAKVASATSTSAKVAPAGKKAAPAKVKRT